MASSRNWPSSIATDLPPGAAVCVGLSGGVDSVVLLDLLAKEAGRPLSAIHVHHGLSPNADAWADFCRELCSARGVSLEVAAVHPDRDAGEGLEAAARAARYAAYAKRNEPFIALAHHLDDQAETVLLQLLRGTGLKGVAAMPRLRALPGSQSQLFRPLLVYSRDDLLEYAKAAQLEWIEDESNASLAFDRNYLRHEMAPILDARFPGWRDSLARFARHAASADALLDEIAQQDGAPDVSAQAMFIHRPMDEGRRANALRSFLARNYVPMPSEARLAEMARQIYDARDDAEVRIDHAGVSLVRHRKRVYIEALPAAREPGGWRVDWRGESELELGAGRGHVRFEAASGSGLRAPLTRSPGWFFRAREGGERIRLGPDRPTRTLKNLLQEHGMPLWQRQNLPLLFHGESLAWVPGIGIAADYACGPAETGLFPSWSVAGKAPLC
jgi:tRNA(Ile)-lysidine synthase